MAKLKIRNKATGEVIEIDPKDAQNYGLSPTEALSRAKAQSELEGIDKSGGVQDPFLDQKNQAQQTIDLLEELYGRGDPKNVGTDKDLSMARSGLPWEKLFPTINRIGFLLGLDEEKRSDYNTYKSMVDNAVGMFSQALGSGVPQEGEAKRLIESAPTLGSSDQEAKKWFAAARKLLATPEMKQLMQNPAGGSLDEDDMNLINKYKAK